VIRTSCPQCERKLAIKPELAGKTVVCECGARIPVPASAPVDFDATVPLPGAEGRGARGGADVEGRAAGAAPFAGSGPAPAGRFESPMSGERPVAAPWARGARSEAGGGAASILAVFASPGSGAVKALWLGLLLVAASFGVKQVLVSWSLKHLGTTLEEPKLEAARAAEYALLDEAFDDVERKLADLDRERVSFDDEAAFRAQREKRQAIEKERDRIRKDQESKRKEIDERYREDLREARRDVRRATAAGLGKAQWTLYIKFALDFLKVAGVLLICFSGLHLVVDPTASTLVKVYATVCGGMAVAAILFGGLVALLG